MEEKRLPELKEYIRLKEIISDWDDNIRRQGGLSKIFDDAILRAIS